MQNPDSTPKRFLFEKGRLPPEAFSYTAVMAKYGVDKKEAKRIVRDAQEEQIFMSDTYQVNVTEEFNQPFQLRITWLSIKRRDKEAFHDWRELQAIKNAICGPEREAVELYPAESRLVDSANQYHLWVLPEGVKWPFGFPARHVQYASLYGAKQRPLDE